MITNAAIKVGPVQDLDRDLASTQRQDLILSRVSVTAAQARNRMNQGHRMILSALAMTSPQSAKALPELPAGTPISSARGFAKCLDTLRRWGALAQVTTGRWSPRGGVRPTWAITEFGKELLS